jgi:hypothetical protein
MFDEVIVWGPNVTLDPPLPSRPQETLGELEVGSTVTVNLMGSGLVVPRRPDPSKLYVRAANVDLWKYLTSAEKSVSFITGCPCVGKSAAVYAYAMWEAHVRDKRVLYIHGDHGGYSIVLASAGPDNTRVGSIDRHVETPRLLFTSILEFLEQRQVDIVVLDDNQPWLIMQVLASLREFPHVRMISCTSFQPLGELSTQDIAKSPEFSEFVMDSWTKEEYAAALSTKALVLHETVTSLEDIFYFAGGNVRLIQWSTERAKTVLDHMLRGVWDIGDLVGFLGVGDASQVCANALMTSYEGLTTVVSKYVAMRLLGNTSDRMIDKARATLPYSAFWQGLVTELEVLHLTRKRSGMRFLNSAGEIEEWGASREWTEEFRGASDPCLPAATPGWLVPGGYRQAGFDALYKASPHAVRAIRVTDARSHSCQLGQLVPFVEAMGVHVVEMVYVCRTHNFETFAAPTPDLEPQSQSQSQPQSQPQLQPQLESQP